jgi:hypothetical protein
MSGLTRSPEPSVVQRSTVAWRQAGQGVRPSLLSPVQGPPSQRVSTQLMGAADASRLLGVQLSDVDREQRACPGGGPVAESVTRTVSSHSRFASRPLLHRSRVCPVCGSPLHVADPLVWHTANLGAPVQRLLCCAHRLPAAQGIGPGCCRPLRSDVPRGSSLLDRYENRRAHASAQGQSGNSMMRLKIALASARHLILTTLSAGEVSADGAHGHVLAIKQVSMYQRQRDLLPKVSRTQMSVCPWKAMMHIQPTV